MILLILGIALIVAVCLLMIAQDGYSDTHEEYMDREFERQRNQDRD